MTSESLPVGYIIAIAARWTKSVKFTLSIAVHTGVLAKNHFWLVATRKKENWRTSKTEGERTALSESGT